MKNLLTTLFTKETTAPVTNETKQVEAIQLWQVTWWSRHGEFSHDVEKEFEAFTDEQVANEFADSLRAAFKLLRHTNSKTEVTVTKRA